MEQAEEESNSTLKYRHRNLINSKYVFERKIGKGSFGCIYEGLNIITQEKVAIKYEAITCAQPTLLWESKILNHLVGIPGVVKLRYFGTESNKNIIVIANLLCFGCGSVPVRTGIRQPSESFFGIRVWIQFL